MYTVKKIAIDCAVSLTLAFVSTIGMLAGAAVWANGLGDKVEEKSAKLFKKK